MKKPFSTKLKGFSIEVRTKKIIYSFVAFQPAPSFQKTSY